MSAPAGHKEIRLTASSSFASLLINGDTSGFEPREVAKLQRELENNGVSASQCVDCIEEGYMRYPNIGLAGDCVTYIFWVKV